MALTFILSLQVTFSIEITKNYRLLEFRDDIKNLYMSAGCENKRVVFLFNDTQVRGRKIIFVAVPYLNLAFFSCTR